MNTVSGSARRLISLRRRVVGSVTGVRRIVSARAHGSICRMYRGSYSSAVWGTTICGMAILPCRPASRILAIAPRASMLPAMPRGGSSTLRPTSPRSQVGRLRPGKLLQRKSFDPTLLFNVQLNCDKLVTGAAFDPETRTVYICAPQVDNAKSGRLPVIHAFAIK